MKVEPILYKNYLALIKNSLGAKVWRNLYAKVDGLEKDILEDGVLSCAYYVSSILVICKLIKEIHTTVNGTVKDMENSGWYQIKDFKKGAVLVWEEIQGHKHIGFYWEKEKAISNNSKLKVPTFHHYTYENKRKIIAIYWHDKLNHF